MRPSLSRSFSIGLYVFLLGAFFYSPISLTQATLVKIAIIDTGADIQHSLIRNNIWTNGGESGVDSQGRSKATNGIDDDDNGFIDDLHGWNFVGGNKDLTDQDGHGTHIAGLVQLTSQKSSASTRLELMILKYYDPQEKKPNRNAFLEALAYAIQMKADVINISGGGPRFNEKELRLLELANKQGILVVAASGNKTPDSENIAFYPAAYDLPNILSVVATDDLGEVLATSNINQKKQNLFAPGKRIRSALPNGHFGYRTGSSQAAAVLTGRIAEQVLTARRWENKDLAFVSFPSNNLHIR